MRMLPEHPYATESQAEKKVFDVLKESFHPHHGDYIALHSFKLPQHVYKRTAEIDFLICSAYGIYVLEVKGGLVQYSGQEWSYSNRAGQKNISFEGPFRQAESAMFSLRERLQRQLTKGLFEKITFGYGVVLPDCRLTLNAMEWDTQLLCQGNGYRTLETWLRQLMDYWQAKEARPKQLTGDELKVLVDALRPVQKSKINLCAQIDWASKRIDQLTEQQLLLLDAVEANQRVMCSGSAGTGKTLMAMELAERWTKAGKKVLLVCRSLWLKHFLTSFFCLPNLTISTLEGLPSAVRRARIQRYDALLIDEGQDLLSHLFLSQVGSYLEGGMAHGCWVFFHDVNNQSGLFGEVDGEVFKVLEQLTPVQVPLKRNCRNTANIMDAIRENTGADMAIEAVGAGPAVKLTRAKNNDEALALVRESLEEILELSGLSLGEVTVLTNEEPMGFKRQLARFLQHEMQVLDEYAMQSFPPNAISLTTVEAFKGLENTAVILCLNERIIGAEQSLLLRYVGMSRAKVLLHVFFY